MNSHACARSKSVRAQVHRRRDRLASISESSPHARRCAHRFTGTRMCVNHAFSNPFRLRSKTLKPFALALQRAIGHHRRPSRTSHIVRIASNRTHAVRIWSGRAGTPHRVRAHSCAKREPLELCGPRWHCSLFASARNPHRRTIGVAECERANA